MSEWVEAESLSGLFDRVLSAAGWRLEEGACLSDAFSPAPRLRRLTIARQGREEGGYEGALSFYRREAVGLAVVNFGKGTGGEASERPEALFNRYLDLSWIERLSLWTVAHHSGSQWLVCLGDDGARLISVEHEGVFGRCPRDASEEAVRECLEALDRDSVGVVLDLNGLGRELASWLDLTSAKLGRALNWGRNDGDRLARHLLFGLKCVVAQSEREPGPGARARLGLEWQIEGDAMAGRWAEPRATAFVELLLDASSAFAPVGTGAFTALERRAMSRQLEAVAEAALAPCLEALRLCAAKLRPHVFLRALGLFSEEHAAWRLALMEPIEVEPAIGSQDLLVSGPLCLDIESCGAGRVVEAIEKLALYAWEHMSGVSVSGGLQLNLFDWQEGVTEQDLREGPFNWVCRRALRVRASRAQQEGLALVAAFQMADLWQRGIFRPCLNAAPVETLPLLFESNG